MSIFSSSSSSSYTVEDFINWLAELLDVIVNFFKSLFGSDDDDDEDESE